MYTEDRDKSNYDELLNRTIVSNAEEIIYTVSATAKLNNDIAVTMRDKLQKHMINFLINEMDAEDYLIKNNPDYSKFSDEISERAWYLHPYIQVSSLVNECVGLSMSMVNGYIKLKEPTGARKDRYTSVSYMNYFVSTVLDPKIRKDKDNMESIEDIANCSFW